jgi:signal transduction histidine kinase
VTVEVAAEGGRAQLSVSDEGEGIPPELAEQAFGRFWRGEGPDAGSGLGLAIVRAIAEAHGGEASIAAGGCTTVRMRLPDRPPQGPLSHAA